MSINESLKKSIDDLDIDRRVEDLNKLALQTIQEVKASVGALAADHRGTLEEWVGKATYAVDARTDGKYHDKMQKFSVVVGNVVEKVADQRPAAADDASTGPASSQAPAPMRASVQDAVSDPTS